MDTHSPYQRRLIYWYAQRALRLPSADKLIPLTSSHPDGWVRSAQSLPVRCASGMILRAYQHRMIPSRDHVNSRHQPLPPVWFADCRAVARLSLSGSSEPDSSVQGNPLFFFPSQPVNRSGTNVLVNIPNSQYCSRTYLGPPLPPQPLGLATAARHPWPEYKCQ